MESKNKAKYVLHGFNCRGRVEHIRYIFAYKDVDYVDHRICAPDWPNWKDRMPDGHVPVLALEDGTILYQSNTILRFLADEFNVAGHSAVDRALIDIHSENCNELYESYVHIVCSPLYAKYGRDRMHAGEYENGSADVKEFTEKVFTPFAQKYEALLVKPDCLTILEIHACPISYADLRLAELCDCFHTVLIPGILDSYPKLLAFVARIHSLPGIARYCLNRPVTYI